MRYKRDEFSIESGIAKGRDFPDWYLDKPSLLPIEAMYMRAFWDLDSERNTDGQTIGRIPWSRATQYAREHMGFDASMEYPFWIIIKSLDDAFRLFQRDEYDRAIALGKTGGAPADGSVPRNYGR